MDISVQSIADAKTRKFLKSVPVTSIMVSEKELVTLDPQNTIEQALQILSEKAISGAPVFDGIKQRFVGYLSVLDLCVWVVRTYHIAKGDKAEFDKEKLNAQLSKPISHLLKIGLESYWPIQDTTSLDVLIDNYFKWRMHRAPVLHKGKVIGHVSQSDVIKFLASNENQIDKEFSKKLNEIGLDQGPVLSVSKREKLIEALSQITETKFTGLAVIDDDGKLYNNISASDLKGITKDNFYKLDNSIENFVSAQKKLPPVTCSKEDTVKSVIRQLADYRVHRTFVVDADNKPTNVITHTSIMKLLSHSGSEAFA
jgi:CBS domain-containing protein